MALAVIPVAVLVRRLWIAAGMRRGDRAVIDAKRQRNKRFANKVVTRFGRAGRPHSIFAVIEHTGRRSGRRYATPVRVVQEAGGFPGRMKLICESKCGSPRRLRDCLNMLHPP